MKPKITKFKTKAWTALWKDGNPGWWTSSLLHPNYPSGPARGVFEFGLGETIYRCEVTVKLLKDKRGKFITKKVKREE